MNLKPPSAKGLLGGMTYLVKGQKILYAAKLRHLIWPPVLLNTVLFIATGWWFIDALITMATGVLSSSLPAWLLDIPGVGALLSAIAWVVGLLLLALWLLVFFYAFASVASIIASPWLVVIARRSEAHLRGTPVAMVELPIATQLWHQLLKQLVLLKWALPLLVLSFIPVVNLLAPVAWLCFGAWLFALDYLDYPMANHAIGFNEVRRRFRRAPAVGFGFGAAVSLAMAVPLLNVLAMPAAVAGATAMWLDHYQEPSHA